MWTSCTNTNSAEARSTEAGSLCNPVRVNSTDTHTGGSSGVETASGASGTPNGWSSAGSGMAGWRPLVLGVVGHSIEGMNRLRRRPHPGRWLHGNSPGDRHHVRWVPVRRKARAHWPQRRELQRCAWPRRVLRLGLLNGARGLVPELPSSAECAGQLTIGPSKAPKNEPAPLSRVWTSRGAGLNGFGRFGRAWDSHRNFRPRLCRRGTSTKWVWTPLSQGTRPSRSWLAPSEQSYHESHFHREINQNTFGTLLLHLAEHCRLP